MRLQVENAIRDSLAKNLSIVEPGLKLIKTNYALRNPEGANGFVDILARDSTGQFTVIELKRSDSSAREAMHEIGKYVDLLSRDKGVPPSQIRAIVISTTWHELLVPFSYYSAVATFPLEGFELKVDSDGVSVVAASPIEPLEAPQSRTLTWHQRLISLTGDASVSDVWKLLRSSLTLIGVNDYVGQHLEAGDSKQALVLCLGTIHDPTLRLDLLDQLTSAPGDYDPEELEDDSTEELALLLLDQRLPDLRLGLCYPEKVNSLIFLHAWNPIQWFKEGVFETNSDLLSEDELSDMVQGWTGLGQSTFSGRARPQNAAQWEVFNRSINLALAQNWHCLTVVNKWISELGTTTGRYDAVAQIYNPSDILNTLVHGFGRPEFSRLLPKIELALDAPPGVGKLLQGILTWDGTVVDLDSTLREVYEDDYEWSLAQNVGTIWQKDLDLLEAWHLSYTFFEFRSNEDHPSILRMQDDRIIRVSCRTDFLGRLVTPEAEPFPDFLEAHKSMVSSIVNRLRRSLTIFPETGTQLFISRRTDA